jgi:hypothetical protein
MFSWLFNDLTDQLPAEYRGKTKLEINRSKVQGDFPKALIRKGLDEGISEAQKVDWATVPLNFVFVGHAFGQGAKMLPVFVDSVQDEVPEVHVA